MCLRIFLSQNYYLRVPNRSCRPNTTLGGITNSVPHTVLPQVMNVLEILETEINSWKIWCVYIESSHLHF